MESNPDTRNIAPRPKRRWLQFGLRAFLVVATVFSAWLGLQIRAAKRQEAAVAEIRREGGEVYYDYQLIDTHTWDAGAISNVPEWIRAHTGDDLFHTVESVMSGARHDDAEYLRALPHLKELELWQPTDRAIRHLATLTHIESLRIYDSDLLTNDGLRWFAHCNSLRDICVSGPPRADYLVHALSELPHLKQLMLFDSSVNDAGVACVSRMSQLESLTLQCDDGSVTTEGILRANLHKLRELTLFGTQVDDPQRLQRAFPTAESGGPISSSESSQPAGGEAMPHSG